MLFFMKNHFPGFLLLTLLVMAVSSTQAQPTSGGPTPTPTQTPIDGGASLLLVGGVGYALRKLRRRRAH